MNPTPPPRRPGAKSIASAPCVRPKRAARALDHFLAAGFSRLEPPVLQPASVFLDMSGEDIRGRLYLTTDASGAELCLRPDYTIPVCLAYLASPAARADRRNTPISARSFAPAPAQSGE